MSDWTLGNVRIFVQKLNDSDPQTIARLGPVGGGTIIHIFGYEDEISKVNGIIVGLTDKAALKAMAKDAAYHTLETPYGTWGDYLVKSVSFELKSVICQKLRSDLPENSPVFDVELELYRDE